MSKATQEQEGKVKGADLEWPARAGDDFGLTRLLIARIYPIHINIIGVVQWYVLCPILSFICIMIISTYVFKHVCVFLEYYCSTSTCATLCHLEL